MESVYVDKHRLPICLKFCKFEQGENGELKIKTNDCKQCWSEVFE